LHKLLILNFLLFFGHFLNAQKILIQLQGTATDITIFEKNIGSEASFATELDAFNYCSNALQTLRGKNYLAASIDSQIVAENKYKVYLNIGPVYKWAKLNVQAVPQVLLNQIGYDERVFKNTLYNNKQYVALCEKILKYTENNGYPFAQIYLDSIENKNGVLEATLIVQKNIFVHIDSIDIIGDVEITNQFIENYLGIHQGDTYSEIKLRGISTKLRALNFLEESRPWIMNFSYQKHILTLFLKNKDANRADILVGLAPSNSQVGDQFFLTGDIKLALVNTLRSGESISLNWQNLQYKSPRLLIDATYPYLLNTPLGVNAKFNYTKNDSTFRNVLYEIGLQYAVQANNIFKTYYNNTSSRLLITDTNYVLLNKQLPPNQDIATQTFGLVWLVNNVDNLLSPTRGFLFNINGNVGIRNIIKNASIENLYDASNNRKFKYLYDSITLKSYQYKITTTTSYYLKASKHIVLKFNYNGAIIFNQNIFKNELYQIGGYRTLRGYDEASLFSNAYHIGTIEPRFLISKNSYVFLLADAGTVQLPYNFIKNKMVFGAGAGISLETKSGLFNILYAVGNNGNDGIQFKNSKIHFGYVNQF
jgi:outer membrane protein assembly factor BamA